LETGFCFAINKEKGLTSLKVVKAVKKIVASKKAGHGGALDPMASGVLVVFTDRLSKLTNFCHLLPKKYIAKIRVGLLTETFDLEGAVICQDSKITLSKDEVLKALENLKGELMQKPPSASAVKVKGRPAYYYFRRKESVYLGFRKVVLKDYRLLELQDNDITVYLETSGGFYVRTYANDLGLRLGTCGGCLMELKRLAVGALSEADSVRLSELRKEHALNWFRLFMDVPAIDISDIEVEIKRKSAEVKNELSRRLQAKRPNAELATLCKAGYPVGLIGRFRGGPEIQIWLS